MTEVIAFSCKIQLREGDEPRILGWEGKIKGMEHFFLTNKIQTEVTFIVPAIAVICLSSASLLHKYLKKSSVEYQKSHCLHNLSRIFKNSLTQNFLSWMSTE